MNSPACQHWRIDYDLDNIAWLTLDRAGEKTNSLSREVLTELEAIVDLLSQSAPRGLIIQSGK
jgi:3-hydroxyacyl-CoA dehydrogenase/enoyl-CoA hydratase/3-hydroxybutyryl-CoA epimerase